MNKALKGKESNHIVTKVAKVQLQLAISSQSSPTTMSPRTLIRTMTGVGKKRIDQKLHQSGIPLLHLIESFWRTGPGVEMRVQW